VSAYTSALCETALRKRQVLPAVTETVEGALAETLNSYSVQLLEKNTALKTAIDTVPTTATQEELMFYYRDSVAARMNEVRELIDKIETLTDKDYWPYPTYYDLLFTV